MSLNKNEISNQTVQEIATNRKSLELKDKFNPIAKGTKKRRATFSYLFLLIQTLFIFFQSQAFAQDLETTIPKDKFENEFLANDGFYILNQCYDKPEKPYRKYSLFGFNKKNNYFYGLKGCEIVKLQLSKELESKNLILSDKTEINPIQSLYNFLFKNNITNENCPITDDFDSFSLNNCKDGYINRTNTSIDGSEGKNKDAKQNSEGHSVKYRRADCRIKGKEDSYVLALSWQPGFCKSKEGKNKTKKECETTESVSARRGNSAENFSLHGLWPNQERCNLDYSFCGEEKEMNSDFNKYKELDLSEDTKKKLGEVMPSYNAGSGLEKHEWHKHGTCQTRSQNDYFTLAVKLVNEFNSYPFMEYLRSKISNFDENQKKGIKFNELKQLIDESLSNGLISKKEFSKSLIFICKKFINTKGEKKPYLVEIQINLKKDLTLNSKLSDSINLDKKGYQRGCVDKNNQSDSDNEVVVPTY